MMMRSAPAASAHLAEIPVPAPAPMMGVPAAQLACHRFRHAARSIMLLLPFASLDHKATIRILTPRSKRKFWPSSDLRPSGHTTARDGRLDLSLSDVRPALGSTFCPP